MAHRAAKVNNDLTLQERESTPEEIDFMTKIRDDAHASFIDRMAQQAEQEMIKAASKAKLAALGLTEAEVQALLP